MKIIAQIDGDNFVVIASADELSKCAGYACAWALKRERSIEFKVGNVVDVSISFAQIEALTGAKNNLLQLSKSLRDMADTLDAGAARVPKTEIKKTI
jgi:hypothetical protein